ADHSGTTAAPVEVAAANRCIAATAIVDVAASYRGRKTAAAILVTAADTSRGGAAVVVAAGHGSKVATDAVNVDAAGIVQRAAAGDRATHCPRRNIIPCRAANDIGRSAGIRLQPQRASAVYSQVQRPVIERS